SSPRLLNRLITLNTRRKLPFTSSSLADNSPCCSLANNSRISSFFNTGNFDVSTPHISTLCLVIMSALPVGDAVHGQYLPREGILCNVTSCLPIGNQHLNSYVAKVKPFY